LVRRLSKDTMPRMSIVRPSTCSLMLRLLPQTVTWYSHFAEPRSMAGPYLVYWPANLKCGRIYCGPSISSSISTQNFCAPALRCRIFGASCGVGSGAFIHTMTNHFIATPCAGMSACRAAARQAYSSAYYYVPSKSRDPSWGPARRIALVRPGRKGGVRKRAQPASLSR
jgi:hypothetical protein